MQRGALEALFDEAAATAGQGQSKGAAAPPKHCAMCEISLQSGSPGGVLGGSSSKHCSACQELLRKGKSIGLSHREVASLHQRGCIREVLGLDPESHPGCSDHATTAGGLSREYTAADGVSAQPLRDEAGIARMGELLAGGKVRPTQLLRYCDTTICMCGFMCLRP